MGANLFGAKLTESDFHDLPASVNRSQKADLIVLVQATLPTIKTYQLTAIRKTAVPTHSTGEKIEHIIYGYQFDEQRTKELNQANWEIEIKELPPNTP